MLITSFHVVRSRDIYTVAFSKSSITSVTREKCQYLCFNTTNNRERRPTGPKHEGLNTRHTCDTRVKSDSAEDLWASSFDPFCSFLTVFLWFFSAVKSDDRVKHFKILQAANGKYHVEHIRQFSSLIDLVEHYCIQGLHNTGTLGNPCKRVGRAALLFSSFFIFLFVPLSCGGEKQEVWTFRGDDTVVAIERCLRNVLSLCLEMFLWVCFLIKWAPNTRSRFRKSQKLQELMLVGREWMDQN